MKRSIIIRIVNLDDMGCMYHMYTSTYLTEAISKAHDRMDSDELISLPALEYG